MANPPRRSSRPPRKGGKGGLSERKKELRDQEEALRREMDQVRKLIESAPRNRRELAEQRKRQPPVLSSAGGVHENRTWQLRANAATASPDSASRPLRREVRRARTQFILLLLVFFALLGLIVFLLK